MRTISSLVYNERGAQFFASTHELMFAEQRYGQSRCCLFSAYDFEIRVSQGATFSGCIRPFTGEIYGDQTDRSGYGWNAA